MIAVFGVLLMVAALFLPNMRARTILVCVGAGLLLAGALFARRPRG